MSKSRSTFAIEKKGPNLSAEQVSTLYAYFAQNNKPSRTDKNKLAQVLGVETRRIYNWFANARARLGNGNLPKRLSLACGEQGRVMKGRVTKSLSPRLSERNAVPLARFASAPSMENNGDSFDSTPGGSQFPSTSTPHSPCADTNFAPSAPLFNANFAPSAPFVDANLAPNAPPVDANLAPNAAPFIGANFAIDAPPADAFLPCQMNAVFVAPNGLEYFGQHYNDVNSAFYGYDQFDMVGNFNDAFVNTALENDCLRPESNEYLRPLTPLTNSTEREFSSPLLWNLCREIGIGEEEEDFSYL